MLELTSVKQTDFDPFPFSKEFHMDFNNNCSGSRLLWVQYALIFAQISKIAQNNQRDFHIWGGTCYYNTLTSAFEHKRVWHAKMQTATLESRSTHTVPNARITRFHSKRRCCCIVCYFPIAPSSPAPLTTKQEFNRFMEAASNVAGGSVSGSGTTCYFDVTELSRKASASGLFREALGHIVNHPLVLIVRIVFVLWQFFRGLMFLFSFCLFLLDSLLRLKLLDL